MNFESLTLPKLRVKIYLNPHGNFSVVAVNNSEKKKMVSFTVDANVWSRIIE